MALKFIERGNQGLFRFPHGFYLQESSNEPFDLLNLDMIEAWCVEQFGGDCKVWFRFGYGFWFQNQIDATVFKLRWL